TLARRVLPGMLAAGWGRIVNVSAAIAARPGMLAGLNTYAASKGALGAHTLNLAAELESTGVTANVYRPGTVDTSMQAYIRDQPREQIGAPLHDRFTAMLRSGALITPRASADRMIARLAGHASGEIWDVNDAIPAP
ncbi:MAG: SDR family NAD(P)-dependent oxidoreductase, partial [Solirubrobacteraceae bacterium]